MRSGVLIIADRSDIHARAVEHILADEFRCECVILDLKTFPNGARVTYDTVDTGRGSQWNCSTGNFDIEGFYSCWWRRPSPAIVTLANSSAEVEYRQAECDHFIQGLLWSLDLFWVNR